MVQRGRQWARLGQAKVSKGRICLVEPFFSRGSTTEKALQHPPCLPFPPTHSCPQDLATPAEREHRWGQQGTWRRLNSPTHCCPLPLRATCISPAHLSGWQESPAVLIRGGWQRSAREMVSSKGCLPTTGWEPLKNSGRKEKKKGEKKKKGKKKKR